MMRALLVLLLLLGTGAPPAASVDTPPYRFKLGFVIAAGTPIDLAARRFSELVRQRTNGEVEIDVYSGSQLGGERAIIEGVQLGVIEMSFASTGAIGVVAPEFHVLDLPCSGG